ncbi:MAG: protein-export chaperone SecB [Betaproteobacteria bacterium]|nr:MAG: protein-export chaperone SecB [Betaproteobacteria bacterium]
MDEQQPQPTFNIEKIYIKDLSLEIPHAPEVFLTSEQPQVEVQLHNEGGLIGDGLYQVVLTVTLTAKAGDKTLFLVEAAQAGIFQIRNLPEADTEPLLSTACPNILFPYVREVVSDVISRAGFPPVYLAPVNFEAMYMQRLQEAQAQGQAAPKIEIAH